MLAVAKVFAAKAHVGRVFLMNLLNGPVRDQRRLRMRVVGEAHAFLFSRALDAWPARLAGVALLVLNAAVFVAGLFLAARGLAGLGSLVAGFRDGATFSLLWSLGALTATSFGAYLAYEAAFPWVVRYNGESEWHQGLDRAKAPLPWKAVTEWCREAECPEPEALEVCWEPNAGIDVKAVLLGRLRLRIGLPLWVGLETRMLRAVVMHELGHFRQHYRLKAVLRHQELGRRIARGSLEGFHPLWKLMAWLWTKVQALAKPWLHALEIEADAYAGEKAGQEWVAATMLRIKVLEQATSQTFRTVQSAMGAGVLPKNLAALCRQEIAALKQPVESGVHPRAFRGAESATHPSLVARIAPTQRDRLRAVDVSEEPAWMPEKSLAKDMTEAFYRHELGESQKRLGRVSVNDARCHLTRSQDALAALEHYFLGLVREAAPIRPLPGASGRDGDWLAAMNAPTRLPLLRKTLMQNQKGWAEKKAAWEAADSACRRIAAGSSSAGLSGQAAQQALQESLMQREAAAADLRNATEQFSQRLSLGLLLLENSDVAAQWPEARLWAKVASTLRKELPLTAKLLGFVEEAAFDVARLSGLETMPSGRRRVCEAEARRRIWEALAKGVGCLEGRDLTDRSVREQFSEVFERIGSLSAEGIVERMENLYGRLSQHYLQGLGDLAYAAGKAELAAGIKPWD